MIIQGYTAEGRRITKHHGGIVRTETVEERDARLEEAAYELVRAAGPELLQALMGLLATMTDLENYLTRADEEPDETGFTSDEVQAIDYAVRMVRRVNPDYRRPIKAPPVQEGID